MLRTCIALPLLALALTAPAADEPATEPADNLQLMMDFAAETPEQPTLFLYKKSFNKDAEIALFREQAQAQQMNMAFRQFYGDEIHKGRLVEEFRDAGYQRVMFIGESEEAKNFVKEAGNKDWQPDFVVPSDYATELMDAEKLDFEGNILIAMNARPKFQGGIVSEEDYKVELEKMRVEAEAEQRDQHNASYGYDPRLCETSRRTGSRLKKRRCHRSQQAKERREQKDREHLQQLKRGNVQRPAGG